MEELRKGKNNFAGDIVNLSGAFLFSRLLIANKNRIVLNLMSHELKF